MTSAKSENTTYDIIGDVHGHQEKLINLLQTLGYTKENNVWKQYGHKAIFVGDLIDKGPKAAEVLKTVKAMVDAGSAIMVIGNHELNWIQDAADYTADAVAFMDATEKHHSRRQLSDAFKYQIDGLIDIFNWLRNQPMYIDHPDLRVVHACWDEEAIATLKEAGIDRLDQKALEGYRDTYSNTYLAIDRVVAGCAHQFPSKLAYGPNYRSTRFRIKWWPEDRVSINPIEIQPAPAKIQLPEDQPPVFFGHYAMVGTPDVLGHNVVGLDYSAAYGGELVAYRHKPGQPLDRAHFVT